MAKDPANAAGPQKAGHLMENSQKSGTAQVFEQVT